MLLSITIEANRDVIITYNYGQKALINKDTKIFLHNQRIKLQDFIIWYLKSKVQLKVDKKEFIDPDAASPAILNSINLEH